MHRQLEVHVSTLSFDAALSAQIDRAIVGDREPLYQLLARSSLGELVRATPAVADNRLYIRGQQHLFCIGKK